MYHTILVPIDLSEPKLTQKVIPDVEAQAKLADARVHFLTVLPGSPSYGLTFLKQTSPEDAPDIDHYLGEALFQMDEIIKLFNIPKDKIEKHVSSGSPRDEILKAAKTTEADLIVIASHHPDITTYLLGSNAAAIVRHAKCSVLMVR